MEQQIKDVMAGRNLQAKEAAHTTVFDELLSSDLPPKELTLNRLQNEAMSLIGAGVETTKWALSVGCFHIINNTDICARLRKELEIAIPDPAHFPPWTELEKLPYLTAIIEESMIFHYHCILVTELQDG
jgi:cytochrome P450